MMTEERRSNPFIIAPGEYWADREGLWERIESSIELARHTRSNEIIVLTGDYGCGTTHTLKYLGKYLMEKGAVASYVAMPVEATLQDIYSKFIKGIDYERRRKLTAKLIEDLSMKEVPEGPITHPEEMEELVSKLVMNGSVGRLFSFRERTELRRAGILDRLPTLIDLWIYIISNLSTPNWPVFILVDEFDLPSMGLVSPTLLNGIRRVYDDSLFGLCLVFGLKGEPKDAKKILGNALHSRMSLQPIPLYPISREEAPEFLKAVLNQKKKTQTPSFSPFTAKAIQTLIDLACPTTPRRLLRICSFIFEEAHMSGLRTIDDDFVSKMAVKYGEISITSQVPEVPFPIREKETYTAMEPILEGIIEYGTDGIPKILVAPEKLTAKEVIGLLLYAKKQSAIGLRELSSLVSRNWKSVPIEYISANLSQIRQFIIMEGKRGGFSYRLSGAGISWVENSVIPRLRQNSEID